MTSSRAILPSLLVLLAVSCSSLRPEFNQERAQRQGGQTVEKLALGQLEKLIEQAKSNPSMASYVATDLFLKANMSLLENDYLTASLLFKYVAELAPQDQFILKKYAISLIRMGNLEDSKVVLEKLYAIGREEKVAMILAGVYSGLDQEDQARAIYKQVLSKNASNEDACIYLSKSYVLEKKTQEAFAQLSRCSKKDPKNGTYDFYVGKLHIDQGKLGLAAAAFKRAIRKQPDLAQAVSSLGTIYEEQEKFSEAIAVYSSHLKKHPKDQSILAKIVQVLFLKERYSEVIPYAETLSDLDPENLNLKVKLGILYTDAKQYEEAISIFKDLLAAAPTSDKILYYMGAIYQELKDFDKSIEYFNMIPTSSGLYADSSVQMANMLSNLAQNEFALHSDESKWQVAFLKLVNDRIERLSDMRVEFSIIKAGYYEAIGKNREALDTIVVVQDEKSFSNHHRYYLANLLEKEKRFEESTKLVMGIIEKEPKNAHAWNFLGYSLLVRGEDLSTAYEYIKKALALNPDDGYIRDSLGWYYYKTGDAMKAIAELELAFRKVPDDIEIMKHLAHVYREMRDFGKAKFYLESALKHARYQHDREEINSSIEALERDRLPASKKN